MNKLIRELADQAIAHANQTWNPDSEPERFVLIAMEKHAELIIRECAKAYHKTRLSETPIETHFRHHFGIEK